MTLPLTGKCEGGPLNGQSLEHYYRHYKIVQLIPGYEKPVLVEGHYEFFRDRWIWDGPNILMFDEHRKDDVQ